MTTVVDTNVVAALMLPTAANAEVAELLRQDPDWRLPPLWRSEFLKQPVAGHQVLALAIATGCSTYDAEFVVLARQLNRRLLTFDRKLLQLFPDLAMKPGS